jgi:hypothetical protein
MTILWNTFNEHNSVFIDHQSFRAHLEGVYFSGKSSIRPIKSSGGDGNPQKTSIFTKSSVKAKLEDDIIEKLRYILKTSTKTLVQVFKEFDVDGNGVISAVEFRQALRRLNLGVTSLEIDKVIKIVDKNSDGNIDWNEFMQKFGNN